MQPMSDGYFDVMDLAKDLRSERLFVESELNSIRQLNDRLERSIIELAQASWTNTQQRSNLKQVVAQGDFASATCCPRADYVLNPVFVDAHKVLRYQDALVLSEVIGRIRLSPGVASAWLVAAECGQTAGNVARALTSGVYGGDCRPVRDVLTHLARHRVATAEDPRRTIGGGTSCFSRLYSELVEGFRPARLFLIAALRSPLLPLLQLDEYLLVDPDKAMERVKKYCSPCGNSSEYQLKLAKFRKWTVSSLVTATRRFITSLTDHWACFPPTIAWVVRQTAMALRESGRVSQEDIHSICTDLIFTNFICQAIMNPEAYGITDIPITNIGRYNLIQISQTLQILCMMKHQEVDSKLRDLYSRFDKESVYSLLDVLLEDEAYSCLPDDIALCKNGNEDGGLMLEREDCDSIDEDDATSLKTDPVVNTNVALFTRSELHLLVSLLKRLPSNLSNGLDHPLRSQQISGLSLEQDFSQMRIGASQDSTADKKTSKLPTSCNLNQSVVKINGGYLNNGVIADDELDGDAACGVTPDGCETQPLDNSLIFNDPFYHDEVLCRILKTIHPDQISRLQTLLKRLPENNFSQDTHKCKPAARSKSNANNTNGNSASSSPAKKKTSLIGSSGSSSSSNSGNNSEDTKSEQVLVIKLQAEASYEPIGLVPEPKVLEWHYSSVQRTGIPVVPLIEGSTNVAVEAPRPTEEGPEVTVASGAAGNVPPTQLRGQEKRTRFSLSHDEGSIGNTSDNLEAASNHSVTSSLEMETEDQNDNLSDMVSANVSGRGSPNISGRDTPSSQVTEGDNAPQGLALPQPHRLPPNAPLYPTAGSAAASKQAKLVKRVRNDIEDKFGKFEIKKLLEGDETISIISDTWSTDVLASDSETIGDSGYDRSVVGQHHNIGVGGSVVNIGPPVQPDASETASESAWSTDALVSDSDRLTEVDIDECNSIGRSDLSASQLDGGTPTHYQFNPHNNIVRDALINTRQQLSADSAHEAHPDNIILPSTSRLSSVVSNANVPEGVNKIGKITTHGNNELVTNDLGSDSSSNASGGIAAAVPAFINHSDPFPGEVVLRKSLVGPGHPSLYTGLSSSSDSSNEAAGGPCMNNFVSDVIGVVSPSAGIPGLGGDAVTNSGSLQGRRPKAYHEHVLPPQALKGMDYETSDSTITDFHLRDANEFPLPLSDPPLIPDSPGAQMEEYPLPAPMPLSLRHDEINVFDFSLQNNNRMNGAMNIQTLESTISTPDDMFNPSTSPFVLPMSSNATSRWLNDPCQKFPSPRPEPTSTPSKNNKRSTSQEDVAALDKAIIDMKRSNTETMFRPIRANSNLSSIDDSGISDLNGCNMLTFLNGNEDLSNQEFSSTMSSDISFNTSSNGNGFGDSYHQDSQNDDFGLTPKSTESHIRMASSSVTTQHCYSSTNVANSGVSRVLKSVETRTSVMNISSSRVDKVGKAESTSGNSSSVSLNVISVNSADSTPTSDKSSTTQEVNSENLTERRISPMMGHVSILNSTDVRMVRGPPNSSQGSATLPRNSTLCTSLKPNASTGAIPKSISFDATAEKTHRHQHRRFNHSNSNTLPSNQDMELGPEGGALNFGDLKNNMKRSGGQILNKIKSLKNKSRGFAASATGFGRRSHQRAYVSEEDANKNGEMDATENLNRNAEDTSKPVHDLTEDILAKYRRKASSSSSEAANSDVGTQQWNVAGCAGNGVISIRSMSNNRSSQQPLHAGTHLPDDSTNISDGESAVYSDMAIDVESQVLKKKLRQVLSNMDARSIELSAGRDGTVSLMCALRLAGDTYLSATLPSPDFTQTPPLQALRRDARSRKPYLSYLAKCRRSLIYTISQIQSEIEWHHSEALRQAGLVAAGRALVSLAGRESRLASLQERLRTGLSDEKRDLLSQTLSSLNSEMAREEAWAGASEWELDQAALTVERTVMSRVYLQAMFPNGDGDILRDQLLREHITRLAACQAGIPPLGIRSSMWVSALRAMAQLPAYKAPLDKVRCVQSCVHSIVALLSTLSEAPGADHLTPALVYVIIKVNPQSLLSTIQYVNTFLSTPLEGELLYCWTQFCSAVEYIKTMDYTRTR